MVRVFVLAVFGALFALSMVPILTSHAAEAPAGKAAAKAEPKADPTPGPPLVAANPEAGAVLVALIDYEDTGAQLLRDKLAAFAKANKDVKLLVKPWAASGGPLSRLSAKAAYAAERQGKFAAFHAAILGDTGSHTYLSIRDLSYVIGLNWEKLAADMDDPKTGEAVDANAKLAAGLKITASPAFVAGAQVFNDPWNKLDFAAMATAARTAKGSAQAAAR